MATYRPCVFMGAPQLLSALMLQLLLAAECSCSCMEAAQCHEIADVASVGASLLQTGTASMVTATLVKASEAAEVSRIDDVIAASYKADVSMPRDVVAVASSDPLVSVSLLQALSSGSGTQHFAGPHGRHSHGGQAPNSIFQHEQSSLHHSPGGQSPGSMLNIVKQGTTSKAKLGSSLVYLVPMGASLSASFALLALVYCLTRGEPAEDEALSRILVGLGKRSAAENPKTQVQAQRQAQANQEKTPAGTAAGGVMEAVAAQQDDSTAQEAQEKTPEQKAAAEVMAAMAAQQADPKDTPVADRPAVSSVLPQTSSSAAISAEAPESILQDSTEAGSEEVLNEKEHQELADKESEEESAGGDEDATAEAEPAGEAAVAGEVAVAGDVAVDLR